MNQAQSKPNVPRLLAVLAGARIVGQFSVNKRKQKPIYQKMGRLFTVEVSRSGDVEVQYVLDIAMGKAEDIHTIHNP